MRGIFAMVVLGVMLVSGAATVTLMLYLFGFIGKG
jgi:hypothetical protein